jgi:signal transduction histidine kinase
VRSDRNVRPSPGPPRRRLGRLDALPIRPETARRLTTLVLERGPRALEAGFADLAAVDPGLALAFDGRPATPLRLLRLLERARWWDESPGGEARERLWRHSVAVGLAAGRLAVEAGRGDSAEVARAGLLADLGWWGLAAADPGALAALLALDDRERRREAILARLGADVPGIGRALAERWGRGPATIDAAWLGALPSGTLAGCAGDPGRLAIIQAAYALAEQTPWRLGGDEPASGVFSPPDPADDAARRRLVAEVRGRCPGPFVEPAGAGLGRLACRRAARLARRDAEGRLVRARASRRLDAVVEAHRREAARSEAEGRRGRLDALAEFAAGAGHELNNPLAVVQGRAQLLLARTSDPEAIRSLRAIIAQAQRAHRILRDLMYVARPPAPRSRPCLPFDLARACLRDLQAEADSRGVELRYESDDPATRLWTDPEALRHLVEVFARNALEATPAGGRVLVVGRAGPEGLVWQFRDGGRGLDPSTAAHLFDPFYCGRQAGRGLGLGLPRAGRYLGQLGGRIGWRPGPDGGTVFTVALPAASEDASPA